MATLKFIVEGKRDKRADFADVSSFCENLNECLRRAFRANNRLVHVYPRFKITELAIGSAVHGIVGDDETIEAVKSNVARIRERLQPVFPMRTEDLRKYRALSDVLESHTELIVFGDTVIDDTYRDSCNYLLAKAPRSIGSVIGRIDGINVHKRSFFRLYPEGQDRGVECTFTDDLYLNVYQLMRKRAEVVGLIHRDPDGCGIDQISRVDTIKEIPEASELPSLRSLFGIMAGLQSSSNDRASGWD